MSKVTLESVAAEFRSGNSVPVERATLTRERMQEALEAYADAKVREAQQWQPIETAPHETDLLLGWKDWSGDWITEVSPASWGWKNGRVSNISKHGQATHWMPIPAPPLPGPVEPTT